MRQVYERVIDMRRSMVSTEWIEWRGVRVKCEVRWTDTNKVPLDEYRKSVDMNMGWREWSAMQKRKARLYYSESGVMEAAVGAHPPYSVKGEDAANDAAWREYNRLELQLARAAIAAAFPEFGACTYNRKAGCSCGCSPAFVSKTLVGVDGWLEVTFVGKAKAA